MNFFDRFNSSLLVLNFLSSYSELEIFNSSLLVLKFLISYSELEFLSNCTCNFFNSIGLNFSVEKEFEEFLKSLCEINVLFFFFIWLTILLNWDISLIVFVFWMVVEIKVCNDFGNKLIGFELFLFIFMSLLMKTLNLKEDPFPNTDFIFNLSSFPNKYTILWLTIKPKQLPVEPILIRSFSFPIVFKFSSSIPIPVSSISKSILLFSNWVIMSFISPFNENWIEFKRKFKISCLNRENTIFYFYIYTKIFEIK